MIYLLDTAAFYWAMVEPEKLSRKARRICENTGAQRVISTTSLWELAVKCSIGSMRIRDLDTTLPAWVDNLQARVLPVEAAHVYTLYGLPLVHRDPFDRMLIAQAKFENLTLVTNDENIQRYDIEWVW